MRASAYDEFETKRADVCLYIMDYFQDSKALRP